MTLVAVRPTQLEQRLRLFRTIGAQRPGSGSWSAYERMKAEIDRDFVLSSAERDRVIRELARIAGV